MYFNPNAHNECLLSKITVCYGTALLQGNICMHLERGTCRNARRVWNACERYLGAELYVYRTQVSCSSCAHTGC